MKKNIENALNKERLIDITTIGRKTGLPRRIEVAFYRIAGKIYITGTPGKRSWYANILANPSFTFHLKQSVHADLTAQAIPILEESRKREVLTTITARRNKPEEIDLYVERSPLIEVQLSDSL